MSATLTELRAAAVPINQARGLLGRARATHYRTLAARCMVPDRHGRPERFGHRPHPPVMPTQLWINQPEIEPQMN